VTGQSTVTGTSLLTGNATTTSIRNGTTNGTISQITASTSAPSITVIGGITHSMTGNGTATSSSILPTNTVPCNGFPEFCTRKYSNISNVCTHNSAYVVKNNAASNQQLPILDQLYDGVRMIQGGTHYVNDTIYNCHTSCDILNAGTFQSMLETLVSWLAQNRNEVLTLLIANSDFVSVEKYIPAIQASGLINYVYTPQYIPQYRDQWPTLGNMILRNQRVVIFMDYMADQKKYPYILDQYSHIWETPFSPQDPAFPCTPDRPPNLNTTFAKENMMYLANHNLNTAIDLNAILGSSGHEPILIPNTAQIRNTNSNNTEFGQSGLMIERCTDMWDRPPTFFVVDYYNLGSPEPGSVLRAVAKANGVVYRRECCGRGGALSGGERTVGRPFGFAGMGEGMGWWWRTVGLGGVVLGGIMGVL
jgi:hypothetical protein